MEACSKDVNSFVAVSLEGISRSVLSMPHKFTGFFITVEKDYSDIRPDGGVGSFQIPINNALSKFSEKCQNLVTHTNSFAKNEVSVAAAIVRWL